MKMMFHIRYIGRKEVNKDISKCLTLIINQSLNSGIFPDISLRFVVYLYNFATTGLVGEFRAASPKKIL